MNYQGKTALITGASSGIGKEFAVQLHAHGANLILVARRLEVMERLAAELNGRRAGSVRWMALDLARFDDDLAALRTLIDSTTIDLLVNNAGRGSFGRFEELSLADEIGMVTLNVTATLKVVHAVIPQMVRRRSGEIISVSSVAAFQPLPFMATYGATKAFNFHHSLALRHELAPHGIKVLALCPGPTHTEFAGVARVPGAWTDVRRDAVEDVVAQGLRALQKNRAFVVPGVQSWLMSFASRILPVEFSTFLTRRIMYRTLQQHQGTAR